MVESCRRKRQGSGNKRTSTRTHTQNGENETKDDSEHKAEKEVSTVEWSPAHSYMPIFPFPLKKKDWDYYIKQCEDHVHLLCCSGVCSLLYRSAAGILH